MMSDHAAFASLQFPSEWEKPRFQLGQTVTFDDEIGLIIGAEYRDERSMDDTDDPDWIGWCFYICVHKVVFGREVVDTIGKHQDEIELVASAVDTSERQPYDSITSCTTLEPLLHGAF